MFPDSKTIPKLKINRHKTKNIIENVLLGVIQRDVNKKIKNMFTLALDHSRDISNKNEFMISVSYLEEDPVISIRRVVYEICEQNNTSSQESFATIKELFSQNKISFRSILSIMSDNANEMIGEENGLIAHFKAQNNSIYSNTCIAHSINLVLANLLKRASKSVEFKDFANIPVFLNKISSYFAYSYKRESDYNGFVEDFLQKMKEQNNQFYSNLKSFPKIRRYAPTGFLSLGEVIKCLLPQWQVLAKFWSHQKCRAKELTLNKEQIEDLDNFLDDMGDNSLKFYLTLLYSLTNTLNKENINFQFNQTKLHVVYPNSLRLLRKFAMCLIKEEYLEVLEKEPENLANFKFLSKLLVPEEAFLNNLKGIIDFDSPIQNVDFSVNLTKIKSSEIKVAKKIFIEPCELIQDHLPLQDITVKSFQLLDITKRKIKNSVTLFRDNLLKKFCRAYLFEDYDTILQEYELLVSAEDENLPNNPFNYRESNLEINVEEYWLDILRNKNSSFKKLAKFMSSLCTIPHSNCFVERMFSIVSANKDKS